jgi:hypothetical protein
MDYKSMYLHLFNAQTDAIEALKTTTETLIHAQQETEEMAMNAPEPEIRLFGPTPEKE